MFFILEVECRQAQKFVTTNSILLAVQTVISDGEEYVVLSKNFDNISHAINKYQGKEYESKLFKVDSLEDFVFVTVYHIFALFYIHPESNFEINKLDRIYNDE